MPDQDDALMKAAAVNDTDMIASLLDTGASVDGVGGCPLATALAKKAHAAASLLLARGANPDGNGTDTAPPVFSARDAKSVKMLSAAGADLNRRDVNGSTPLHMAAASGSSGVIKALLTGGADPSARAGQWGFVPLQDAARLRRVAAIRALMTHPPAPNLVARAMIELIQSPKARPLAALAALLDAGADPNEGAGHPKEILPIHIAAASGNVKTLELLVGAGADLNRADADGQTAVLIAAGLALPESTTAEKNPFDAISEKRGLDALAKLRYLIEQGADQERRCDRCALRADYNGMNALEIMATREITVG